MERHRTMILGMGCLLSACLLAPAFAVAAERVAPADLVCRVADRAEAAKTSPEAYRFQIVDDRDGRPAAKMAYGIRCGEQLFEGLTGTDGWTFTVVAPPGTPVKLDYVYQTEVDI